MFTDFYAKNKKRAFDLRAFTKVILFGDTYTVDAYSVPTPGMTKLWVTPVSDPSGEPVVNPVLTLTVSQNYEFEIAN